MAFGENCIHFVFFSSSRLDWLRDISSLQRCFSGKRTVPISIITVLLCLTMLLKITAVLTLTEPLCVSHLHPHHKNISTSVDQCICLSETLQLGSKGKKKITQNCSFGCILVMYWYWRVRFGLFTWDGLVADMEKQWLKRAGAYLVRMRRVLYCSVSTMFG